MKKNKILLAAAVLLTAGAMSAADNEWNIKIINGVPRMAHNGEVEKNFIFCAARIDKGNRMIAFLGR